jgi:hypothetical protein
MDTAVKTAMDSQALKTQAENLRLELREQMSAGSADDVIRIQTLLRDYPVRIAAAEIAELRASIDSANQRLTEISEEIEYVESVRAENNKALAELIKKTEEAGLLVKRNELALVVLENEAISLREGRRDMKNRLQNFLDECGQMTEEN